MVRKLPRSPHRSFMPIHNVPKGQPIRDSVDRITPLLRPLEEMRNFVLDHPGFTYAAPFPHVVIDNFLPPLSAQWAEASIRGDKWGGSTYALKVGPRMPNLFQALGSAPMTRFLQSLTGIDPIIYDENAHCGGIHQAGKKGFIDVHLDYNWDRHEGKPRILNVLIFFNRDWEEAWGGHFELHKDGEAVVKILPVYNRAVIFEVSERSWHGVPKPLRCPEDRFRRGITAYYYTEGKVPEGERHGTYRNVGRQ